MKKHDDMKQQNDDVIRQVALRTQSPVKGPLKTPLYLCLVPDGESQRFALRYHEDRTSLQEGANDNIIICDEVDPKPIEGEPVNIDIEHNSHVIIELYEKFEWRWSQEFAGVVLKRREDRKFYGDLRYAEKLEGPYMKKAEFKPGMTLRFLRFTAKYNKLPKGQTAKHPYCLNMEFRMPGAASGWVPMSLDPDIGNPHNGSSG